MIAVYDFNWTVQLKIRRSVNKITCTGCPVSKYAIGLIGHEPITVNPVFGPLKSSDQFSVEK